MEEKNQSNLKIDELYACSIRCNKDKDPKKEWEDGWEKFHYTSLSVLFSMLETDSFWVSSSRFSNDDSEEKLLSKKELEEYSGDNYIFCLCDKGDQLSQWRGYCPNGGAAIEFSVSKNKLFSVLEADYETKKHGKHETRICRAIPVIYTDKQMVGNDLKKIKTILSERNNMVYDMVPYLKNKLFYEERESRMVFSNTNGMLSQCIRFRTKENGIKVPYMIAKAGDLGKDFSSCEFDLSEKAIKEFVEEREEIDEVWIPQGSNQEAVYYKVASVVDEINKEQSEKDIREDKIRIFCEGHLPIKRIITAPTYDRERIAEAVQRFCQSKYWLRSVEVRCSEIPYIPPSI